jgi:hypothetical protein
MSFVPGHSERTPTDEVNKRFPQFKKIRGIVCMNCHYGFWVEIPGIEIRGLVDTTGVDIIYPEIGTEIEARVVQFRDSENPRKRHFRLILNP